MICKSPLSIAMLLLVGSTVLAQTKTAPPAVKSPAKPAPVATPAKPAPQTPGAVAPAVPAAFVKPNRPLPAITSLAFSPDGKKIAVGTYGEAALYDATTFAQLGVFKGVEDSVRALAFHPDSIQLAVGSGQPGLSGKTVIWNTSGQSSISFPNQFDTVESLSFRKDGKSLIAGANDNRVRFIPDVSAPTGPSLDSHNGRVQAVAFSPKNDYIFVSGAMDKIVKVWDVKKVRNVINFDQSEAGITGLVFLDNGDQFVGSSLDGKLYWWGVGYDGAKDSYNGYHFRTIGAHEGGVYCLARSEKSNRMITGGPDHSICIWDINNGGQIRAFREASKQPFYAAALSPDGKIAVGGGREGLVFIWDIDANKLLMTFAPPATSSASSASGKKK